MKGFCPLYRLDADTMGKLGNIINSFSLSLRCLQFVFSIVDEASKADWGNTTVAIYENFLKQEDEERENEEAEKKMKEKELKDKDNKEKDCKEKDGKEKDNKDCKDKEKEIAKDKKPKKEDKQNK